MKAAWWLRRLGVVCAVAAIVWAIDRFVVRLDRPGALLLIPLAYVSAVFGATAGMIATLPLVAYYAYHITRPGSITEGRPVETWWSMVLFALSAWSIALIVGRATTRRRRRAADIAEHTLSDVRAEAGSRVARSEGISRAVLDALPSHVAVIDSSGQILMTNARWREFLRENGGAMTTSDIGSNYLAACRDATPEGIRGGASGVAAGIETVLRGEARQFSLEYPCHAPDRQRWFLLTVTPLAQAGVEGITGAVISHIDITERKQIEESTRQRAAELAHTARALKRTNEELDQFAYITSHDLRAPLRGIANLSRWIEEDLGESVTPEVHKQLELMRGRVGRMEGMIDGILEYSRIGRVKVSTEQVDVAVLLADVTDLLDPPEQFTIQVESGMPIVLGHRLRLQQVFLNLLSNAIKHHDKPSGRIVVACRDVGDVYEFSVSDDGPGIEPQYHEKIFVIFQTLQARDRVESTGVGLSLVKKTIEAEGGTVTVESELGKGTTFRFTWPKTRDLPANGETGAVAQLRSEERGGEGE